MNELKFEELQEVNGGVAPLVLLGLSKGAWAGIGLFAAGVGIGVASTVK